MRQRFDQESPSSRGHLSRILGLSFGIAVIFGGTVGVGILRLPGEIAGKLGSAKLVMLVWLAGGVYSMLGAISLSEVGAALPQAGGFYVYSKRAFGPAVGFAVGWSDWMINCASIAYATVAAAEYIQVLTAGFTPALLPSSTVVTTAIALILLAIFCGLQFFGLRLGSRVQKAASLLTGVTFLALAIACLLHRRPASTATVPLVSAPHGVGLVGVLVPIIAILPAIVVAFDGWYEAIYFSEEDTNAAKHLPQAMIGCVVLITGLYLLMNLSFLHVLTIPELGRSKLAAADAARLVFPHWSGDFVTVLSLLTLLSLTNALLLGAPRILFAVGRDGLFPDAAKVGPGGTPRTALLGTTVMVAAILLSGRFDDIVAVAAILMAATYCVNYLAVIVLRVSEPDLERPFRAWGYPWTTGLVLTGSLTFLIADVWQDHQTAIRAVFLLAIAGPVYWWSKRRMQIRRKQLASE